MAIATFDQARGQSGSTRIELGMTERALTREWHYSATSYWEEKATDIATSESVHMTIRAAQPHKLFVRMRKG
ncbi:hypothetical protein A2V68_01045 [candidate division Kazan bacterium RBG_13_50_9]|uniref:Uncharacterized protein n=1 Tax=candidate division Kazan bacterium RBG_13_50_9 TaxID=1798535 RepID=A0A1F4NS60_UNCK3|nr:MAG: hypothetical protein A2V68_01045 [candidate division Kazan bacterium RBG_13_50_9]